MDRINTDQAPAFDIVRRLHEQAITLGAAVGAGTTPPEQAAPLGVWDTLAQTSHIVDEITSEDMRCRERLAHATIEQLHASIRRADAVLAQLDAHDRPVESLPTPETTSDLVGLVAMLADTLAAKLDEIVAVTVGRDETLAARSAESDMPQATHASR